MFNLYAILWSSLLLLHSKRLDGDKHWLIVFLKGWEDIIDNFKSEKKLEASNAWSADIAQDISLKSPSFYLYMYFE